MHKNDEQCLRQWLFAVAFIVEEEVEEKEEEAWLDCKSKITNQLLL